MQGERRLADAALLIEERDDHRATAGIEICMGRLERRQSGWLWPEADQAMSPNVAETPLARPRRQGANQ
jgi:hypothetical protein